MYTDEIITPVNVEDRRAIRLRAGDTVRVWQKVQEKGKVALQAFEGLVISAKHGTEAGATFTVRATIEGVGVEKTFPLYSPLIDKIEIVRHSKVRRSKLYYIRKKFAKTIRQKLRRSVVSTKATLSDEAEKKRKEEDAKKKAEEIRIKEEEAKKKAEEAQIKEEAKKAETVEKVKETTEAKAEGEEPKEEEQATASTETTDSK